MRSSPSSAKEQTLIETQSLLGMRDERRVNDGALKGELKVFISLNWLTQDTGKCLGFILLSSAIDYHSTPTELRILIL